MVECGSLENCYTRKRIGSSNLPLSVSLLLASLFLPTTLNAEIIQLKNGNAIETKILKEDDQFVIVEAPSGKVKIPRKDIQMIWRGTQEELLTVRGKAVYFSKGVELYKEGRFKEAAEKFEQARNPGITNAILYANLGSAYASAGEAQKAKENFLKALEQKPNDPDILLNLARLYETQKDFKPAIQYYQKLTPLRPDDPDVKRSLAYCHYMSGDYLTAAKLFEELGKKNDIVGACNAAEAYIQAGQVDQASAILGRLIDSASPVSRAYFLMAEVSRLRKDYSGAENYYRKALKQDPDVVKVKAGLGRLYLDMQEWEKAEAAFKEVLEKDPGSSAAIYELAQIAVQKKEYAKALDFYEQLLEKDPRNLAMLDDMGLLYLKMNEPKKALEVFRKILGINERYAKGHANAGLAYAFLEDADKAIEEWTRALELDPKLEAAARNKKILEDVMQGTQNEKTAPE